MKDSCARQGAVAIDLGATSARYAAGWLEDGTIHYELVAQRAHAPIERNGRLEWDLDALLKLCREAVEFAESRFESATVGIDSWGVDHGFLDSKGNLLGAPVCYRDRSHEAALPGLDPYQARLYALTGIQRQPFNTLVQLVARRLEDPTLPERAHWVLLPDLFAHLLGGTLGCEISHASTTQLLGLDSRWSDEAFAIAGWPVPAHQPSLPGALIGRASNRVAIARVAGHDTASAVCGLGPMHAEQAFLNVGTWSLLGCVLDEPLVGQGASSGNFSNERAADGRVRFLKNIPGFYIVNRLHEELGIADPVPDWLARADRSVQARIDVLDPGLFNPPSMLEAIRARLDRVPGTPEAWAGLALMSLVETTAVELRALESATDRKFNQIRASGGGAASNAFCHALTNATGCTVSAGPLEATLLGNLAVQMLAKGIFADYTELGECLANSAEMTHHRPRS